jgi:hypothetical protein
MDFESHNLNHIKAECSRHLASKSKTKSIQLNNTKQSILLGIVDYRKLYKGRKSKKIRIN